MCTILRVARRDRWALRGACQVAFHKTKPKPWLGMPEDARVPDSGSLSFGGGPSKSAPRKPKCPDEDLKTRVSMYKASSTSCGFLSLSVLISKLQISIVFGTDTLCIRTFPSRFHTSTLPHELTNTSPANTFRQACLGSHQSPLPSSDAIALGYHLAAHCCRPHDIIITQPC